MSESDAPQMLVSAIRTARRDPNLRDVFVDGRRAATISARDVEALNLEIGREWTESVARHVERRRDLNAARSAALRLLATHARSRAELINRLAPKYGSEVAAHVVGDLQSHGWVDDRAMAKDLIAELTRSRPAGPILLAHRLRRKGIPDTIIAEVLSARSETIDDAASALAFARTTLAHRQGAGPAAAVRRVGALLVRRGFEEDTIRSVLEILAAEIGIDYVSPHSEES